jgi:5-hydroxyisourate hydrolase-like protein (transthyretin family)
MKRITLPTLCVFFLAGVVLTVVAAQQDSDWTKVEQAMKKGLPKTAVQELEPIIRSAITAKNYDEAAKAICMKIALQGQIQGDKPEEKITRLEAAMTDLPQPMQPIMEVVLAHWYWQYFQQNRWRFMQRTQQAEPSGDDITTWDLPRILAEIDRHFSSALKHEQWLKKTPITEFKELLVEGSVGQQYRPTMYDFVAYEALNFYTANEQAGARGQDPFVLQADSPMFAKVAQFLDWEVDTPKPDDSLATSPLIKAIGIYQSLLEFHRPDEDVAALADSDLQRLKFGSLHAVGEEKNTLFKTALERHIELYKDDPIAARSTHELAQVWYAEGDFVRAHQLATEGTKRFPDSVGAKQCHNLIEQIEAKSMAITIERVWNNPWPQIEVEYRNLDQVHFRVVRYDWKQLIARTDYQPHAVNDRLRKELLSQKPDFAWSHELPATDDYQLDRQELPIPRQLKPGFHFLIASSDPEFQDRDAQIFCGEFWFSPLALVLRTGIEGAIEGFVLDADTGEPLEGAQIRTWQRQDNQWKEIRQARSNTQGLFRLSTSPQQGCVILARHGDHELATANQYRARRTGRQYRAYERTVIFTDRALYRPGQTVRYKGICISVDEDRDNYKTLAGEAVTVVFSDHNGQEIAKHEHRTNELGSFNGSFTAPRDRLTGRMRLHDPKRLSSRVYVNVEEYKRPKFKVELAAPKQPARLGGEALIPGTAKAYTGAPIGQAKVAYRVVREVRYPVWWGWLFWRPTPRGESQEITHGITTTDDDGYFEIAFTAHPDPAVSEKEEPTFRFTVYADVTDLTGETRSDQHTVNVGFTSLKASMAANTWQTVGKPVELIIETETLDGEPQAAKGTVKVYHLDAPATVQRPELTPRNFRSFSISQRADGNQQTGDLSDPNAWPLGEIAAELAFATDASGTVTKDLTLDVGAYRAILETQDDQGKTVTALLPLQVLDPAADRLAIKIPHLLASEKWHAEPGETFTGLWGTGYESGRAFIEVEHRGKILQSYWTDPARTQVTFEQNVSEAMRGGFTLRITQVRENRAYLESRHITVPWSNKELEVRWEHFVSKLQPGQREKWTAVIQGPGGAKAAAEMVATLYDASLDAYLRLNWPSLEPFRRDRSSLRSQFENRAETLRRLAGRWPQNFIPVQLAYPALPPEIVGAISQFGVARRGRMLGMMPGAPARSSSRMESFSLSADSAAEGMPAAAAPAMDGAGGIEAKGGALGLAEGEMGTTGAGGTPDVDLTQVSARKNLHETAFFFPHLVANQQGEIALEFTMPEALTEWRFLGFAHDTELRSGSLTDTAVTSKDLMVQPLPPRFVREGDRIQFTVKVTNQSPTQQTGTVRLSLSDASSQESVDAALGNEHSDRDFDIPAGQSRTYSWEISIPDGMGFLVYKAVGATQRLSDGEEGYLPVLPRRILVTESLPLPIRDAGSRDFRFDKLLKSGESDSLQHQSLTVQMVSQPAWYAVMALPYLMEFPYECTEQTFNRLYANALARHIANADPKIRRIFDQWKGTPALDSPLEKNEDLKAVALEETPWVRQAQKESESRRQVGILFDDNRLNDEMLRLLQKLGDQQMENGAWPWFPGGRANNYITLYITTGFGRLRHLGADVDVSPAVKALSQLDRWIHEGYQQILEKGDQDKNHLSAQIALYLYGRSFFLDDLAIDAAHRTAVDYYLKQAREYWLQLGNRQSQAHLALALCRFGQRDVAEDIMRSIKERSVSDDELGMFWRDAERSWWWYRAPIETQAMMIEAFDEVMHDMEAVGACRVWLLKQKQTQDWKTTKATADAVYALLLRGTNLLTSDALVQVELAGKLIEPEQVEAGTGFYQQTFTGSEVKPEMGQVRVTKTDDGVAWGSLHWQYLEDMSKITPYDGTPLTLKKELFIKTNTAQGPVLNRVTGPISVGDELVTRIELRVDRAMEYVHLKDQRGSGVEPVDVLSRYRFQDGLAYYQSTRDTASHFFIDYLPKGSYVFEYSSRVTHRGEYQSGMAQIQCMYAPEFGSHSESLELTVE